VASILRNFFLAVIIIIIIIIIIITIIIVIVITLQLVALRDVQSSDDKLIVPKKSYPFKHNCKPSTEF